MDTVTSKKGVKLMSNRHQGKGGSQGFAQFILEMKKQCVYVPGDK